jgi:hypothetical protein
MMKKSATPAPECRSILLWEEDPGMDNEMRLEAMPLA